MPPETRRNRVLRIIVETYVQTAQPVSSAAVLGRSKSLGVSPATVRAIMAELESDGLLSQPHTSAGRIPTDAGLRAYLDALVSPKLHPWDRTHLDAATADTHAESFASCLGQTLAGLSRQVAVVAMPRFMGTRLREMGLVRCGAGRFLAYFVSPSGLVQQRLVTVDFDLTAFELDSIQSLLNAKLAGRTLVEVRVLIETELEDAKRSHDEIRRRAFELSQRALPDLQIEVCVVGTAHLAGQPEFADGEQLRQLLQAIEEKTALLRLLDELVGRRNVRVMLGSEHHVPQVAGLSCVGRAWAGSAGETSAISLLGPRRMDYGRLVPLVDYATTLAGRFWDGL